VTAVLKEPLMGFRNIEASRIFAALIAVAFGAGSSARAARGPVIPATPAEIPAAQ